MNLTVDYKCFHAGICPDNDRKNVRQFHTVDPAASATEQSISARIIDVIAHEEGTASSTKTRRPVAPVFNNERRNEHIIPDMFTN